MIGQVENAVNVVKGAWTEFQPKLLKYSLLANCVFLILVFLAGYKFFGDIKKSHEYAIQNKAREATIKAKETDLAKLVVENRKLAVAIAESKKRVAAADLAVSVVHGFYDNDANWMVSISNYQLRNSPR